MALPLFTALRYLQQLRAVLLGGGTGAEFRAGESQAALIRAMLKGIFDSLCGAPDMLRKRRQVMKHRRVSASEFSALLRRHRITFRELLDHN
jgi:hypothetical protein